LGNTRMLLRLLPERWNEHLRYARDGTSPADSGPRELMGSGAMWQDLAALTPPLVVCVAFIIGLVIFLRRQLGPRRDGTPRDRRRSRDRRSWYFTERPGICELGRTSCTGSGGTVQPPSSRPSSRRGANLRNNAWLRRV